MSARLIAAVITASLAVPAVASADEVHQFVEVTSASLDYVSDDYRDPQLVVTAKLQGGSAETWRYGIDHITAHDNAEKVAYCHRLAVLAMSKPGKFRLDIVAYDRSSRSVAATVKTCGLTRID